MLLCCESRRKCRGIRIHLVASDFPRLDGKYIDHAGFDHMACILVFPDSFALINYPVAASSTGYHIKSRDAMKLSGPRELTWLGMVSDYNILTKQLQQFSPVTLFEVAVVAVDDLTGCSHIQCQADGVAEELTNRFSSRFRNQMP